MEPNKDQEHQETKSNKESYLNDLISGEELKGAVAAIIYTRDLILY